MPVRRNGFSQSLTDFNAWAQSDPNFANGWQGIQQQLTAESSAAAGQIVSTAQQTIYDEAGNVIQQGQQLGQGVVSQASDAAFAQLDERLNVAKLSYVSEYEALLKNGLNEVVTDPAAAAKQFVLVGNSIAGAVQTVGGLINTFDKAQTLQADVQIGSAFCGVMISIATAAGAISAGLGALIVGLIGAAVSLLQQAGLFKTTQNIPISKQICSNVFVDVTANLPVSTNQYGVTTTRSIPLAFTVGCVAAYTETPQISPGAQNWRSFPTYKAPLPTDRCVDLSEQDTYGPDLAWFVPISKCGPGVGPWKNAVWSTGHTGDDPPNWAQTDKRAIDAAFPVFRYLECEMSQSGVTDFQKAFFAAWKANKEYELNGLVSQPDYIVFLHLVRLWNQSHANEVAVAYTNKASDLIQPYFGKCDPTKPPYFQTLIEASFNQLSSGDPGVIQIHNQIQSVTPGQDAASQQNAIIIHGGKTISVPPLSGAPLPASVIAQRLAGASLAGAAVAALGVVAYSQVSGVALGTVAKGIWDAVKAPVAKLIRRA